MLYTYLAIGLAFTTMLVVTSPDCRKDLRDDPLENGLVVAAAGLAWPFAMAYMALVFYRDGKAAR